MKWRAAASTQGHSFNICEFVLGALTERFNAKGRLKIEFYDRCKNDDPAYVTFEPLTLHIDRRVWSSAAAGQAYARFIVAHEIGHIVLHDQFAVAFSQGGQAQLNYLQDEESGEWQANVFAGYFLAPDHLVLKLQDPDVIAGLCVITDELAVKRLSEASANKSVLSPTYEGDMCGECGNFTLLRNGTCMKCDTCGSTTACS
jgi:hypothetical protein